MKEWIQAWRLLGLLMHLGLGLLGLHQVGNLTFSLSVWRFLHARFLNACGYCGFDSTLILRRASFLSIFLCFGLFRLNWSFGARIILGFSSFQSCFTLMVREASLNLEIL